MKIHYKDLILINAMLREHNLRYRVSYQDNEIAGLEPPGACCRTQEQQEQTAKLIEEYYQAQQLRVVFSKDFLYYTLQDEN